VLTDARLIRARKNGRQRIYELAPSGGQTMRAALEQLRELERFWDVTLNAFKQYAEKSR
jgi:hypothetical protein